MQRIKTPVSAKIRIFPKLEDTLRYARLLEAAGASLVAVHGRTRDQKNAAAVRADWDSIRAVKAALRIPVLANGDVRCLADARRLLEHTGADGVMSASPLLNDPALFWPPREAESPLTDLSRFDMALEYLDLAEAHPVPMRMVRVCCPALHSTATTPPQPPTRAHLRRLYHTLTPRPPLPHSRRKGCT